MSWKPEQSVKLLKTGSDTKAPPVWVLPVNSGVCTCFDSLLNSASGYKRTIYSVTDPYLTGNNEALTMSFDDWIGLYVSAVKTKQAKGPYTLMGYSQGMHWCFAVSEALQNLGEKTDSILVLDPNFPAWSMMDRAAVWDGPQMAKGMGAPWCILKWVVPYMLASIAKSAKWETQAAREATVAKAIATETKGIDIFESVMMMIELDAGIEIDKNPAAAIKAIPAEKRMEQCAQMIAAKVEGFDVAFCKKLFEFMAISALRWPKWTPKPLPKDVDVTIFFGDKSWAPSLKQPYSLVQGFDRFVEGGRAQIDEIVISYPYALPEGSCLSKLQGMNKLWAFHWRFMHEEKCLDAVKKQGFAKIGLL